MKKTRFMTAYQFALLPLYLICCIWLFVSFLISYGLPNMSVPISCTITVALTEFIYIAYIVFLIFLLIKFKEKSNKIYTLNMLMLFTFPIILQIGTVITQVILYETNEPTNVTFLSYVIVYILIFCLFFLPQVIYFKKRKYLFGDNSANANNDINNSQTI